MKKHKVDFSKISIEFLEDTSTQRYKYISDWLKACEDSKKPKEDTWTKIDSIPGYIFKNLRMKTNSISDKPISPFEINYIYDERKLI